MDPFESPVDVEALVPPTALPGAQQMMVTVGMAAFALLLMNAHALAGWTAAQPPGSRAAAFDPAAQLLASRTAARGFDAPRAAIKSGWEQARAARWPAQR